MKNDLAEMEEQEGFRYKPIGHVKSVFQGMNSLLFSPKKSWTIMIQENLAPLANQDSRSMQEPG